MKAEFTLTPDEVAELIRAHITERCKPMGLAHVLVEFSGGYSPSWKIVAMDFQAWNEHEKAQREHEQWSRKFEEEYRAKNATVIREPDYKIIASIPAR